MLIGLNGKKQAGKDTVHSRIVSLLGPGTETGATVERVSFADKLYESAAAALGVTADQLREWKSDYGIRVVVERMTDHGNGAELIADQTVRAYLQHYGTEAHRDVFGPEFWVEAVDLSHEGRIVVVTDVRFANEAQAVADAGGTVVQVIGPVDVEEAGDGHASEAPLPHALVDGAIYNDRRDDGFAALDRQVLDLVLGLLREERVTRS